MKTGIEVTTSFFPLAWFLYFCTPVVEINGTKVPTKWGTHYFDLVPGDYTVRIYFPYMMMRECGANSVRFLISEGQTIRITFHMGGWMFSKGRMTIV